MTRRALALAGALVGLLLVGAAPAAAEEQPPILKAYGLDWIERVREEAWPQPKAQRPIICLLDTGVAITPDTPADDPSGPIVARLAVEDVVGEPPEPGSGLPQGVTFQHMHGTQMASIIAAPRNGYGTVGVFPQARIVSVRVTLGSDVFITPNSMVAGVRACNRWAFAAAKTQIAAVVMAESFYDQRPVDSASWTRAATEAQASGAVFVAAVGNRSDAQSLAPVAVDEVVAVSAGDPLGGLCPGAKYESGIALVGPGCDPQRRWPSGSSSATAAVGGLVAALSTRGGLTPAAVREALFDSAASLGDGRRADGTAIALQFFKGMIEPPRAPSADSGALRIAPESADDPHRSGVVNPDVRLWRPAVRARWTKGHVVVIRTDRKSRGRLALRYRLRGKWVTRTTLKESARVRLRASTRPSQLAVWVVGASDEEWRSLSRRVRVTTE